MTALPDIPLPAGIRSRMVRGVNGHGGVRMEPVPGAMQERPVLTADQIRQLAELGTRAEEAFGAPQDMEWGFDEPDYRVK